MQPVESTDVPTDVATIVRVLETHPVWLGVLFGSLATGATHPRSDIDVAVELEDLRPGNDGYNEAFLGLAAALSESLGTDDFDLVDLHTCTPTLADRIFETGILLVGDQDHATALRRRLTDGETEKRSPRERFDETLARIDEHLA